MRAMILVGLSVFVAGCASLSPMPSCPTEDVYEYLSCAEPTFSYNRQETDEEELDSNIRQLTEWIDSYCEEDAAAWLPVLDKAVKKNVPEVRRILRVLGDHQRYYLQSGWSNTLQNDDLFRGVLATYTITLGLLGKATSFESGNCIDSIDQLSDGLLVETLRDFVESGEYEDIADY